MDKNYIRDLLKSPNEESLDKIIKEIERLSDIITKLIIDIIHLNLDIETDNDEFLQIKLEKLKLSKEAEEKALIEAKKVKNAIMAKLGISTKKINFKF